MPNRRLGGWTGLGLAALLWGSAAHALELFDRPRSASSTPAAAEAPDPSRETLADLLLQVDTMQNELRKLRGQVEVQANEIERLKTRQRELIADIDRRVQELERRRGAAAPIEATTAGSASAPAPTVNAANAVQEQQDYDAAFGLLKQGFYERAAKGFRDFIAKYPQSNLRDNAQYWLGESYYVVRNFRQAAEEFSKVVKDHPKSPKAPDAMLKSGYSHYELGEWAKARESLSQVTALYPGTTAAKSAEQRLAKMKKEKH
jgi:tol-pal system protein YbgF